MWRLLAIIAVTLGLAAGIYHWPHAKPAPAPVAPHAQGKPQRIVCLAPSLTETVFALGAGDRVVGVTKWCDYPPEAKTRTVVGGMGMPNLEVLVALKPDLILAPSFGKTEDYEKLRELGYRVEIAKPEDSVQAVLDGISAVGAWIGEDEAAKAFHWKLWSDLGAIQARLHTGCVFGYFHNAVLVVGHDPLFVAGQRTFAAGMLAYVFTKNECWDLDGWSQCNMESLLAKDPEFIFDSAGSDAEVQEYWRRWPGLSAVKNGRVYAVDPNTTNRPGPRIQQGLEQMARLLYPEAFPKPEGGK